MKTIPVRVMVRVRPLSAKEKNEGATVCMTTVEKTIAARETQFTYDYVFPQKVDQVEVFAKTVDPMLKRLFEGYNQTVFAYGQTGSGKTFTMGGEYDGNAVDAHNEGIIPRVADKIFATISELEAGYKITARVSYFELYKEDIRDLLKPDTDVKLLQVREMTDGQTTVSELSDRSVSNRADLLEQLKEGNTNRTTGATNMNATSSRSHAVFTVRIEQQSINDPEDTKCSSLHLIDLAGSERLKRTGAEGKRKEEGVQINLGLLALGNVISALSDGLQHVPYRDSKLTRILKDSLGGNSHTLMIACVSPADTNYEESLNSLRYADRARKIKNKPIVNRDPVQAELIQLRKELQILRANGAGGGAPLNVEETDEFRDMKEKLEEQLEDYRTALAGSTNKAQNLLLQVDQSEKARKETATKLETIKQRAADVKENHNDMTLVGEQLEQLEMDDNTATVYNSLRQLHKDILELEGQNKKRRISFANNPRELDRFLMQNSMEDIEEVSLDGSEVANGSVGDGMPDSPQLFEDPLNSHKINEDIFEVGKEIETKEDHIKKLLDQEENPHLLRAQFERQITELTEKLEKLENEKQQVLSAKAPVGKDKNAKVNENRRKRLAELEKQIANYRKDRVEKERLVKEKKEKEKFIERMRKELEELKVKKVGLLKKAKQDQKKFCDLRQAKDREIKTLQKADRRRLAEMAQLKRQKERVENVLRIKTEQTAQSQKRLERSIKKRNEVRAAKAGSAPKSVQQNKEFLLSELDVRVNAAESKNALENMKEQRSGLQKRWLKMTPGKQKNNLKQSVDRKTAEIGQLQRKIQESGAGDENPCNAKKLPLKDVAEARKMIEFLYEQLVEKASKANILKLKAKDSEKRVNLLTGEFDVVQQSAMEQSNVHQRQLHEMTLENAHELEQRERLIQKLRLEMTTHSQDSTSIGEEVSSSLMPKPKLARHKKGSKYTREEVDDMMADDIDTPAKETPVAQRRDRLYDPKDDMRRDGRRTVAIKRTSNETVVGLDVTAAKRKSRSGCKCKGNCSKNLCSCKKAGRNCLLDNCGCNPEICINREPEHQPPSDEESDKENETMLLPSAKSALIASMAANARSPDGHLDMSTVGLGTRQTTFTPQRIFAGQTKRRIDTKRRLGPQESGTDFTTPKKIKQK